MNWFRTIPRFVRALVALFLVAQFAGVVSSPRANAQAVPIAAAYHRTDWLGTMNAVVDGALELPARNRQAATIRMSSANAAIRSMRRGSCS